MIPDKLPLASILDCNRTRKDYGDIEKFGQELKDDTLIQPIILSQRDDGQYEILAGSRRRAALLSAGFEFVYHGRSCVPNEPGFLLSHEQTESKRKELELIENIKRKEMTWQERCVGIAEAHALKKKESALIGNRWGQRETAELFNIRSMCDINWSLNIAALILAGDQEVSSATNLKGAWDVVMRREEEAILKGLAGGNEQAFNGLASEQEGGSFELLLPDDMQAAEQLPAFSAGISAADYNVDDVTIYNDIIARVKAYGFLALNESEAYTLWSHIPNNTEEFLPWFARLSAFHSKREQDRNAIPLSQTLFHTDCLEFMLSHPNSFDAIITDIPYGIDMDNLNQDGNAVKAIDSVLDEHTVSGNLDLFDAFFPAAYSTLRTGSFLITWCDQSHWERMTNLATSVGFKVQRWPITWVKLHPCMNQTANTNFTKTTEIALVCRKGVATLTSANIPCHILASHDAFKDTMSHPFVKPFDVWRHLIESTTLEGQSILEPFAGHGSGVISAIRLKRKVTACELNDAHYSNLVENVKKEYLSLLPNSTFV